LELLKDIVGALAIVAAFVIGVLLIGRRLAPAGSLTGDRGFWVSLLNIAWSIETRAAALGLAACAAVLVALGALVVVGDVPIEPFRLNAEQTIPAAFSGLLLVGAGSLGLLAGRLDRDRGAWAWLVLGAALITLAIDEMAELHERLEARTDLSSVVVVGPLALPLLIAFLLTQGIKAQHGFETVVVGLKVAVVLLVVVVGHRPRLGRDVRRARRGIGCSFGDH